MISTKLLNPIDLHFLAVQTLGTYLAFDAIFSNPTILAAGITLISTLITVGFNVFKLYWDNKKAREKDGRPPLFKRKKRK